MSFKHQLLVIPDGLGRQRHDGSWQIHPALQKVPEVHIGRWIKRQWFSEMPLRTVLEWYVHLLGKQDKYGKYNSAKLTAGEENVHILNATAWLMLQVQAKLPAKTLQCWQVMPFAAQIRRSEVHVFPSHKIAYTPTDAHWLAETINPLLHDLNMVLLPVGAALLLCTQKVLDVQAVSFANINSHKLPNRPPKGRDAAFFMRILAEIQMLLHQTATPKFRQDLPTWQGLWFWQGTDIEQMEKIKKTKHITNTPIAIQSNDPIVASLCPRQDASLVIAMSEQIGKLPAQTLLAGDGQALLLSRTYLPHWHSKQW